MNTIEVIARGVLIKDGYLLVCRPVGKNYCYLPGGHVEFFETAQEALQREWQEELDCSCEVGSFLNFFEERFTDSDERKHHEYTFLYRVNCASLHANEDVKSNQAHIAFEWVPVKDLRKHPLLPKSMQTYLIALNTPEAIDR